MTHSHLLLIALPFSPVAFFIVSIVLSNKASDSTSEEFLFSNEVIEYGKLAKYEAINAKGRPNFGHWA